VWRGCGSVDFVVEPDLQGAVELVDRLQRFEIAADHQAEARLVGQGQREGLPVVALEQVEGSAGADGAAIVEGIVPLAAIVAFEVEELVGQAEALEQSLPLGLAVGGEGQAWAGAQGGAVDAIQPCPGYQRMVPMGQQLERQGGDLQHLPAGGAIEVQLLAKAAEPGVGDPLLQQLQGPPGCEVTLSATDPGGVRRSLQALGEVGGDLQAKGQIPGKPVALVQVALREQHLRVAVEGPEAGALAQQQAEVHGTGFGFATHRAGIALQALSDVPPGSQPAEMVKSNQPVRPGERHLPEQ